MSGSRADQWVCGYCSKFYVVPSLARDCERKHEEEEGKEEEVELAENE